MTSPAGTESLLVPDGTRLLHIGPPKTGTTSLQAAFWAARDDVRAQGVCYAGRSRHSTMAVWAVTERKAPGSGRQPPMRHWQELLDEIRRAPEPRLVLSSEGFAFAKPQAVRRVVDDLDPDRVHVVMTLRPLARIVASVWQERAQNGLRLPYEAWLRTQLEPPPGATTPYLWRLHRHDRLVERWGEIVGARNITVVVVDERDRAQLLRVFERLVGLREGTLAQDPDLANRSLTLPEVEAIQALSARFEAEGMTPEQFHRIVRLGAAGYLKTRRPPEDEPTIETPPWALDHVGRVAEEMVGAIASSGVRVVGNLADLTAAPEPRPETGAHPEDAATADIAAWLAMGMYRAAPGEVGLDAARSGELARALAARARAGAVRRLRRVRRPRG